MKILLAVSGSISAYKSYDICRGLCKEGHEVKIILTKGACEFVHYKTFYYLGAQKVYQHTDDFNPEKDPQVNVLHIELVKWCDQFVICPASANTIAKLANGLCDDLLTSCFLALSDKPCLIFPAMNTQMLTHPITQKNLNTLKALSHIFIHPTAHGELACGDKGKGKLPDSELIVQMVPLLNKTNLEKNVLITAGATISPLDPVRYITNPSSGLTGIEIAKAYLARGAKVTIIFGYNIDKSIYYFKHHPKLKLVEAKTTDCMLKEVSSRIDEADIYISTAAMSDIKFKFNDSKIKKVNLDPKLEIEYAPDVLKSVLDKKVNQKIVGFAAETSFTPEVFLEKWKKKPVDLLIGNQVNNGVAAPQKGFGNSSNTYLIIQDGKVVSEDNFSKKDLAFKIVEQLGD
jgi:phosphopantothenoylcysteine decarboxylase/phosphopantothenate--cysteine ligase